jgi:hypothetical protein
MVFAGQHAVAGKETRPKINGSDHEITIKERP